MKVYAEFKPCRGTRYLTGWIFDKEPIIYESKACFVDGEYKRPYGGSLFITDDLRYVYCLYYGEPSYYRVTNISTKPISKRVNKVEEWHRITQEINELKEERRRLVLKPASEK